MNRMLSKLMLGLGLIGVAGCVAPLKLGNASVIPPSGWRKVNAERERITFASTDDRQQTTISLMAFEKKPTFEDFKRICLLRLEAEKADAPTIVLEQDEPFEDAGTFGMFFSGKEPESGRLFSGHLTQKDGEILTIYVESVGVDSKRHFQSFQEFVEGLKR